MKFNKVFDTPNEDIFVYMLNSAEIISHE